MDTALRTTALRTALIELVNEAMRPLSVPEIFEELAGRNLHPHKTSLYREIETLVKSGVWHETHLDGVQNVYSAAQSPHPHMVCRRCKRKLCIDDPNFQAAAESMVLSLQGQGFAPNSIDVVVSGLCDVCAP